MQFAWLHVGFTRTRLWGRSCLKSETSGVTIMEYSASMEYASDDSGVDRSAKCLPVLGRRGAVLLVRGVQAVSWKKLSPIPTVIAGCAVPQAGLRTLLQKQVISSSA